jgi:dTDP-D-glucose 4,6-dehydratase
MRPTISVTAGAGFIGGAFVRQAIGDGSAVVVNLGKLTCAEVLNSLGPALDDRRPAIDASKIGRELGWRLRMSFEQGLEQTARRYVDNRAWVDRVSSGEYRRERLGIGAGG